MDTPMWKTVDALFADTEGKEIGQKKREVGEAVPLGYMDKPSDVDRVAVSLASNQSNYITAQTISVDGGDVLR
jgi:NAD(P)-dependent dehydrogenase (short-subunit alcohol dehydrogenase family)